VSQKYTALAAAYDALMTDVDYAEWADYIADILEGYGAKKIIEAGCGTGAISVELAKRGYELISTDASEEMLTCARENAAHNHVNIIFSEMDMRELASAQKKDAVIACMDVANYLANEEDFAAFLNSAKNCLKSGGVLLFDMSSPYKLENILAESVFYDDGDDITCLWTGSEFCNNSVELCVTIFERVDDMYERRDETQTQYAWSADKVTALMEEAGFEAEAYDFMTDDKPNANSERIQYLGVLK